MTGQAVDGRSVFCPVRIIQSSFGNSGNANGPLDGVDAQWTGYRGCPLQPLALPADVAWSTCCVGLPCLHPGNGPWFADRFSCQAKMPSSRRPRQGVIAAGGGKPDHYSTCACGVAGFGGSGPPLIGACEVEIQAQLAGHTGHLVPAVLPIRFFVSVKRGKTGVFSGLCRCRWWFR